MRRRAVMSRSGFSLIEIAMVLAVAGIIMAGTLATSTKGTDLARVTETNRRIARVIQAVYDFDYGKLYVPCPADASLARSSANFGKDLDATSTATARTCTGSYNLTNSAKVVAGGVPVRTLQLPDEYAFDAWGRRLTYAVDTDATAIASYTTSADATNGIKVRQTAAGANIAGIEPIVVVYSEGKNGHGAFPSGGSSATGRINTASTDTDEQANSHHASNAEAAFDAIFVQKPPTDTFDDILQYHQKQDRTTAAVNGYWIAGGIDGGLGHSSDGLTWTTQTYSGFADDGNDFNSIAYDGAGTYVGVGDDQSIATSSDGTNWTLRTSPITTPHFENVASNKQTGSSALWVTVGDGGAILSSPDGITWTDRTGTVFGGTDVYTVAHNAQSGGSGLWVAAGASGKLRTSPDGVTWTTRTSGFSTSWIGTVAHNQLSGASGLWVAVGESGKLRSSTDGITWTSRTSQFGTTNVIGVAHNRLSGASGLWVAVGDSGKISTSADGITWTARTSGTTDDFYRVYHNGLSGSGGLWVAVSYESGHAFSSPDGITWTDRGTVSPYGEGYATFAIHYGGIYHRVLAGGRDPSWNGMIAYSGDDGVTWTKSTSATTVFGANQVLGLGYYSGTWVAVGQNGAIATSTDRGVTWTARTSGTANDLGGVAHNQRGSTAGLWVAAGLNGTILSSSDGITWTKYTSPTANENLVAVRFNELAGGAGQWIVAGDGQAFTSPDGATWTNNTTGATSLSAVLHNHLGGANGLWVASGRANGSGSSQLYTSTNGTSWTMRAATNPVANSYTQSGAYANGAYVFVSDNGAVMRSTDGLTWTGSTVTGSPFIRGMDHNGEASSPLNTMLGLAGGSVYKSTDDGATWNDITTASATAAFGVGSIQYAVAFEKTATTPMFVAIGDDGVGSNKEIYASNDGVSWGQGTGDVMDFRGLTFNRSTTDPLWFAWGYATWDYSTDGVEWTYYSDDFFSNVGGAWMYAVGHNEQSGSAGLWLASGTSGDKYSWNGRIATSTDARNWTLRTNPFTNQIIRAIEHNGQSGASGLWAIMGHNNGIATSPDGITWTVRTSGFGTGCKMGWTLKHNHLAGAEGLWVATANDGDTACTDKTNVATSPDGVTWTMRTRPGATGGGVANDGSVVALDHNRLTGAAGLWVLVGEEGYIATSPDGITWTARASGTTNSINGIAYMGGLWVATASEYETLTSTDGITWTKNTSTACCKGYNWDGSRWGVLPKVTAGWGTAPAAAATTGSTCIINSDTAGKTFVSTNDGDSWSLVSGLPAAKILFGSEYYPPTQEWMVFGETGADGKGLYLSTDLSTWTNKRSGLTSTWDGAINNGVAGSGKLWMDFDSAKKVFTSPDGTTWTQVGTTTFAANLAAYSPYGASGGMWIVIGGSGALATSTDNGVTWTVRTSNLTGTIEKVTHNGLSGSAGLWIAADSVGKIATSPDGITWTQRNPGLGADHIGVAHNGLSDASGKWVVGGGTAKKVATSPDGITWTVQATVFSGLNDTITYNRDAGLFMIAADDGKTFTSPDGITWTQGGSVSGIGYTENLECSRPAAANWVAVAEDGKLATSPDGTTWTLRDAGFGSSDVWDVAYNGTDLWVAVSDGGKIASSPDGITWTQRASGTADPLITVTHNRLAGAAGKWVAVAWGGETYVSSDGITWAASGNTGLANVWRVAHNGIAGANGLWIAVSDFADDYATSTDGATWTVRNHGAGVGMLNVFYNATGDYWLMSGNSNTIIKSTSGTSGWSIVRASSGCGWGEGVVYGNGLWVNAADSCSNTVPSITTSPNGTTWTTRTSAYPTEDAVGIAHNEMSGTDSKWVIAGSGGKIQTSTDGITWTGATSPFGTTYINRVAYKRAASTLTTPSGPVQWVAVAEDGKLASSPDSTTWTIRNAGFGASDIYDVAYNGFNLWVAVGVGGKIASSSDGITWTQRTSGTTTDLYAVGHNQQPGTAGKWIAVTSGGDTYTSTDGITWAHPSISTGATNTYSIAHNGFAGAGGLWLSTSSNNNRYATSPDGVTWTARTTGQAHGLLEAFYDAPTGYWYMIGDGRMILKTTGTGAVTVARAFACCQWGGGIYYGNGLWVAAADGSSGYISILSSPDGSTWTTRTPAVADVSLETVAHNELTGAASKWVVGGDDIETSTDGITWTAATSPFGTSWIYKIVYKRSIQPTMVAVGGDGVIIYSSDGITWTQSADAHGTSTIYGVAHNGSFANPLWVAVGSSNKISSSPDGITWTARTSPFASGAIYQVAHNHLSGAEGKWMIGNGVGLISTSTDGITWSAPVDAGVSGNYIDGIDHNGESGASGLWTIAPKTLENVATSPDGVTWTLRTTPVGLSDADEIRHNHLSGASGLWVRTGGDDVTTSSDGITWTHRFGGATSIQDVYFNGQSGADALWIGIDSAGVLWKSTDAIAWAAGGTNGTTTDLESIAHNGLAGSRGVWAIGDTDGVLTTSPDGTTWTIRTEPFPATENITHIEAFKPYY